MAPRRLAATLALASLLAACVAPARSSSAYEGKTAASAEAAVSAARTVLLAAGIAGRGSAFSPTVSSVVADAEGDAQHARDAFASIQPPDTEMDRLRSRVLPDIERVIEVIARVRIAARRGELEALQELAAPLRELTERLDRVAARYG